MQLDFYSYIATFIAYISFIGPLLDVIYQHFSHSVNVFWNLTSKFDSNGVYLIVRDKADLEFIAPRILGDTSSLCINNLEPNTDYSLTVLATFNCDNVSESVDFRTMDAGSSDDSVPSQNCIKYDPPQPENGNDSLMPNIVNFCMTCSIPSMYKFSGDVNFRNTALCKILVLNILEH